MGGFAEQLVIILLASSRIGHLTVGLVNRPTVLCLVGVAHFTAVADKAFPDIVTLSARSVLKSRFCEAFAPWGSRQTSWWKMGGFAEQLVDL